ncbi:hypothetical protein Q5425_08040 [Amycolatopsis sp. A133]|uniref:hypothetical protein n=1 Tax=Amycolatopsis sp. A133 TaxID=3064472 RepID=UPI0027F3C64A|nr:hypothetical protein [Amycolatopsis sp. A133]MDQ7803678.1 hypothetical protein [Amycolatopsis sp. A133]
MAEGSFWKTAPGVLTAVAGVITAVGGLLAILFQVGVLGSEDKPPPAASGVASSPAVSSSPATSPSSAGTAGQGGKPWTEATAVITPKDGDPVEAPASTVRFCIGAGMGINLNDSLDVAFEKMSGLEVTRSDPALSAGGKATVKVHLTSGKDISGTITSGCDFFAESDIGRYSLYPDRLAKIEFRR